MKEEMPIDANKTAYQIPLTYQTIKVCAKKLTLTQYFYLHEMEMVHLKLAKFQSQ